MTRINSKSNTITSIENWLDQDCTTEEMTILPYRVEREHDISKIAYLLQINNLPREKLVAWTYKVDKRLANLVQKVEHGIKDDKSNDKALLCYMKKAEELLEVRKQLVEQISSLS